MTGLIEIANARYLVDARIRDSSARALIAPYVESMLAAYGTDFRVT